MTAHSGRVWSKTPVQSVLKYYCQSNYRGRGLHLCDVTRTDCSIWERGKDFSRFKKHWFPISRSLSTSRRRTDELGSRLERPIHFECKLNEPMHIGMRLLHPAAADHSVSINRQQVQRIFSFSLRSRAVLSFCSTYLFPLSASRLWCWRTAIQRWWSSLSSGLHTSGCTTPCCVAATISPVRFSTLKEQTLL